MAKESFLVIGAGAWGTALSIRLAKNGLEVSLTSRDKENLSEIRKTKQNKKYLPGINIPESINIKDEILPCLANSSSVLLCVKSTGFKKIAAELNNHMRPEQKLIWATKGLDPDTGETFSEIIKREMPSLNKTAIISGPTFAEEVAKGKPTAITLASENIQELSGLASIMSSSLFRVYTSNDIVGVQLGGAFKNIIAIAAGASDALSLGANARTALITRGLEEMKSIGVSFGAKPETFFGLSGLGDLVLTSTDNQSRNRRLGLLIGSGMSPDKAIEELGTTPEGVYTVKALYNKQALQEGLPIANAVYSILFEGVPAESLVNKLMTRPLKEEF
jgi:glycerol-3-phosphate dehydrogenase (NAD(P)+)